MTPWYLQKDWRLQHDLEMNMQDDIFFSYSHKHLVPKSLFSLRRTYAPRLRIYMGVPSSEGGMNMDKRPLYVVDRGKKNSLPGPLSDIYLFTRAPTGAVLIDER